MTSVHIVDDDRARGGMVASLLGSEGYELITAYDGETAVRRHAEELPDLVILDRGLPKMTGEEVTRRIRATSQTPILMLTSKDIAEDRERARAAGVDAYLIKPFNPADLEAAIRPLLAR